MTSEAGRGGRGPSGADKHLEAVDFKGLADRSQDAVYHLDLEQDSFLYINDMFRQLFGGPMLAGRPLTARLVMSRVHPEDRRKLQNAMNASLQPGRPGGEIEYRLLLDDGSIRWLHDRWIVVRDKSGRGRAVEGFIRDNTADKLADQALEASKSNALVGSYIVQDGSFRYVNPEFVRITGYTASELIGLDPLSLLHEEYRDYVLENARAMLKGQRTSPYEFCIINKSGDIRWIMETITSIQYGGRRAVLGYFMDITKMRSMQHNLSSLGLMVGALSHSLKGCLTGLDAGLYLIDSGFYQDQPARIEEGLDAAKMMVDRLKKLVYEVLYNVKDRSLEIEKTDVEVFINELSANMDVRLRGADISFSWHCAPGVGTFEIDRELMRTALINILENALEACLEDDPEKIHQIALAARPDGGQVLIGIEDNGPGMTETQIKNVFTLFYSSKSRTGTGLGLFITKKVIQQHGGSISVDSAPGRGARFRIRLPRTQDPDRQTTAMGL